MKNKNINHGSSIGYRGTVTVKVLKRNKVLAAHIKHNSGLTKLFTSLCGVLTGETPVRDLRPVSIALYSLPEGSENLVSADWETIYKEPISDTNATLRLTEIIRNIPLTALSRQNAGSAPAAIFQAVIPYVQLKEGHDIYLMALYPAGTSAPENALAYYKLANANGWTPIQIDTTQSDQNLLIEWQMDFTNKSE